ncbi:MAG: hypothetical protein OXC37_06495 [Bdellovibrionaceae bacterium]|nr:hypothetical protein [Pseudobdellovibrionaceae bacterium]
MFDNKNYLLVLTLFFFFLLGCKKERIEHREIIDHTELIEHTEYVEGKGYCVGKYDERGCNICSLQYPPNSADRWSWICTQKYCLEPRLDQVNLCTHYLSIQEIQNL